jgi:hypothetical protein
VIVASKAEPASFGELFDRYADEIYRYIARRLPPRFRFPWLPSAGT